VNECQPFWKTLKERIVSFFRNFSPEKKDDKVSSSRFWPFSSSAKSASLTSSSPNPSVSCELEQSVPSTPLMEMVELTELVEVPQALPDPVIEILDVNMEIKRIVEAIIFAANRPMTVKQIQQVFPEIEQPELIEILGAIESITEDYRDRPIELKHVASGYRFQVREELSRWVSRLFEEKPPRYSRALLETLAIIAYRQPVTRGEIEDIRGVGVSSSIIQTLLERDWIKVVAHKEAPGRPGLYGTTKQFLDYFNVTTLNDLPTLQEIQDLDLSVDNSQYILQEESEKQTPNEQDEFAQATTDNQEDIGEELGETTAV
jgi:segregation and condensation protein B